MSLSSPSTQPLLFLVSGAVIGIVLTKLADHITTHPVKTSTSLPLSTTPTATTQITATTSTTSTATTGTTATTTATTSTTSTQSTTSIPPTLAISDPPTLRFQRFGKNELLLGIDHTSRIFKARVLVMGTGGVGSWAVESLARAGVGFLVLVDPGLVKISNCSQQIPALSSTIGRHKVQVLGERIREINPDCEVVPYPLCADETTVDGALETLSSCARSRDVKHEFVLGILSQFWPLDVVIDCADKITDKVAMMTAAHKKGVPCIVTTLGAATRLDPALVRVADVSQTSHCPVGKQVRKGLMARGIRSGVTCVYSIERPRNRFMTSSDRMVDLAITSPPDVSSASSPPLDTTPHDPLPTHPTQGRRVWTPSPMGSWVFVPAMFGLYAAHHAIMFIGGKEAKEEKETSKKDPGLTRQVAAEEDDDERDLEVPWKNLDIPSHGFAHRRQKQLAKLDNNTTEQPAL